VRAAIHRVDVVGEAEDVLRVAVVILQRHFHGDGALFGHLALRLEVDRLFVQHALAAIQVLDELADAALVDELGHLLRIGALVGQRDLEALVQERQFAQPLRQRVVVEHRRFHDGQVGFEGDARAGLLAGLARLRQGRLGNAAGVFLLPGIAPVPDLQLQAFGKRVDAAHAHAVKAAGNLVALGIELAAGVQFGHHHLRRRNALRFHDAHGMPRPSSITVTELSSWMMT
jgi:predicted hotdog family 3-hydroxylacyl-ACP dehydratase